MINHRRIGVVLILVSILFGSRQARGSEGMRYAPLEDKIQTPVVEAINLKAPQSFLDDPYVGRKLDEIWNEARKHYLYEIRDVPSERRKFFERILRGGVGDYLGQHSGYLPPEDYTELQEDTSGRIEGGIGVELEEFRQVVFILRVIPDGPAAHAGAFEKGDVVVMVGTTDVRGKSAEVVAGLIRGSKGSSVVITVERNNKPLPPITLVRDTVVIPSVVAYSVGPFLYVHIISFDALTTRQFYGALKEYAGDAKGLIVDLRNDSGGLLSSVEGVACPFSNNPGDIVITLKRRDQKDERRVVGARKCNRLRDKPVVGLVNGDTASAAEILAGVLRDWRHAPLVGKPTYGKGVTQDIVSLNDHDALKIVATEYRAGNAGLVVDKKGLTPDYEVNGKPNFEELSRDAQFQKALEVLEQEVEKQRQP